MSEGSPHLANAADIERWADERVEARTLFPRLIRQLIFETNDQVTLAQMRAELGAGVEGYDGIVEAGRGTPFVPAGRSVWELGTSREPADKANRDYRKRTDDPLGEDKANTTFVFVTSRRWAGGQDWGRRKQAEGQWGGVRVLDVDDIEMALEQAPATLFRLSEWLGKPVAGVRPLDTWWEAYRASMVPELTPELVLAGRADQAAELIRLLDEEQHATTVLSESTDDVLAFVASVLTSSSDEVQARFLNRALIIMDAVTLRRLQATASLLVLLPYEEELRREAQLVTNHHIIYLAYHDGPADITLPPIDSAAFREILIGIGVEDEKARTLAAAARQSVVRYQRHAGRTALPASAWQQQLEVRSIRRAWLCGGWDERRSGDLDVLSALLGSPLSDVRDELAPASEGADPLFTVVGNVWRVSSRLASWPYARRRLSTDDLDALEQVVQSVLGAVDPALDLPVDERWAAGIYGRARIHSAHIRKGVASTLAFLAAEGQAETIGGRGTASSWADATATHLLRRARGEADATLWISMADVLPLLAETAPDSFLEAVEEGLQGSSPQLAEIFQDSGEALSASSPHTYLLWALEGLAWSSKYAGMAVELLARLAEVDPGGRISNRPAASLTTILKPWLPQTTLAADRRLRLLDLLIAKHEGVAWNLMLSMLPDRHAIGFPSYAPEFRDWKPKDEAWARVSLTEYWSVVDGVVTRLLQQAGQIPSRWAKLVEEYDSLSPPERSSLREHISAAITGDIAPELAVTIWNAADELIRKHRTFSTAQWAIGEDEVAALEQTVTPLKPAEPDDASRWLFDDYTPDLGDGRGADMTDYMEALQERRTQAAREILASQGLEGALELAERCKLPGSVGFSVADAHEMVDEDRIVLLLESPSPELVKFAEGYIRRRVERGAD
jgi:hypothetical protein